MISLTCTSCKKVLQIDDAFAGGVCRCQHCGTIQTVPSSLKNQPNASGTGAKTLYQRKAPTSPGHGGASAVATADAPTAGSARVRAAAPQNPADTDHASQKLRTVPLLIGGVVLVIVVVAFIFWLTQ